MKRFVWVLALLAVVPPVLATETVLFWDPVSGYDTSEATGWGAYTTVNPSVVKTQDSGGFIGAFSSLGPYTLAAPNQFVNIASGSYGTYTTIAAPQESSARYGQVMARVAKESGNWMRLAVFDVAAPSFPGHWDSYPWVGSSHAGPDLMWHPGGNLYFFNMGSVVNDTGVAPTTTEFYDVTLNYDWQNQTYEGWYNQTKLFGPVTFDGYGLVGAPKSVAIAGAYWGAATAALDYWHWKASDTAFTSPGVYIPEPFSIVLLGAGGVVICRRRNKTTVG